jgi:hypothetical protein
MIPFWLWCEIAKRRPQLVLRDGSSAKLLAVKKNAQHLRVLRYNRHVHVHYDDIHGVFTPSSSLVRLPSWQPFSWAEQGLVAKTLQLDLQSEVRLPEPDDLQLVHEIQSVFQMDS